MKFSHALVWAAVAMGLGADAKLFGKDKREFTCGRSTLRRGEQ